jgi:hypothetical protein
MSIYDLNEEQLREVKERYYMEHNVNVSWGELANIEELVTMEEVVEEYGHITFVDDDFFCSMNSEVE